MNGITFAEFGQSSIDDLQNAGFGCGSVSSAAAGPQIQNAFSPLPDQPQMRRAQRGSGAAPIGFVIEAGPGGGDIDDIALLRLLLSALLQPQGTLFLEEQGAPERGDGLTQAQIANDLTPPFRWPGDQDISDRSNLTTSCTVCLSDFENGEECRQLPCGHIFHKACVDEWLLRAATCPICKGPANKKSCARQLPSSRSIMQSSDVSSDEMRSWVAPRAHGTAWHVTETSGRSGRLAVPSPTVGGCPEAYSGATRHDMRPPPASNAVHDAESGSEAGSSFSGSEYSADGNCDSACCIM